MFLRTKVCDGREGGREGKDRRAKMTWSEKMEL
jgi:hypothetical protein